MKALAALLLFLGSAAIAQEAMPLPGGEFVIQGRITRALTGADIVINGKSVHLAGVRAPKRGRICIRGGESVDIGSEVADGLEHKLAAAEAIIQGRLDEGGRIVGRGTVNGQDIGELAVMNGFAVTKIGDVTYAKPEREARNTRPGLWSCNSFPKTETLPEAAAAAPAPQLPPPVQVRPWPEPKSRASVDYAPPEARPSAQPVDPEDDFDIVLDDVGGFFEDVFNGIDRTIRDIFGAPPQR